MVTELQQKIYDEIAAYADLEKARENAEKIALQCGCSDTYVRRIISRKEDEGAKVEFKITPKEEPEESESDEQLSEDDEDHEDMSEDEEEPKLEVPDDWEFETDEDEEPEAEEPEVIREVKQMDLSEIISKENCSVLIATPFRLAAEWTRFEGWALTTEENKRLTPMFRAILIKYLPTIIADYFAEIIFAVVIIEVVGSKAKAYRDFQEDQLKTRKAQKQAEEAARKEAESEKAEDEPAPKPPLTKDSTQPHWLDGRAVG